MLLVITYRVRGVLYADMVLLVGDLDDGVDGVRVAESGHDCDREGREKRVRIMSAAGFSQYLINRWGG